MATDIRENLDYFKGIRNDDLYNTNEEEEMESLPMFDDDPQSKKKKEESVRYTPEYQEWLANKQKEKEDEDWYNQHSGDIDLSGALDKRDAVLKSVLGVEPNAYRPTRTDIRTGIGDYGKYNRERKNAPNMYDTYTKLMDKRAELQPGISKFFNGIGKMGITGIATFVNGTAGMLWGLITSPIAALEEGDDVTHAAKNAINRGIEDYLGAPKEVTGPLVDENGNPLSSKTPWTKAWNRIWDNEITSAVKELQDWSEKSMPNYYTEKERNGESWWNNFFTANFWGDKFFKNLGFTIGAFYAGKTFANTLRGLNMGKYSMQVAGTLSSAVGEGMFEALTNAKEWEKLEIIKANDEYLGKVRELKNKYKDPSEDSDFSYLAQVAPEELNALKSDYQQHIAKIKTDSAHVGNTILALNIPILGISDFIRFGRAYAGNYNPFTKWAKTRVKGGVEQAAKKVKAGTFDGNMYAYKSLWSRLGIPEGRVTDFLSVGAKNFIAEGAEEWFQRVASNKVSFSGTEDVKNFMRFGSDYKDKSSYKWFLENMWSSVVQTAKETGANGAWEEFFIGGLTGLLGVPGFRNFKSDTGRWQSPIYFQESALHELFYSADSERRKAREDVKSLVDKMNKFVNDAGDKKAAAEFLMKYAQGADFSNFLEDLGRLFFFEEDAIEKAKSGDKIAYEHSKLQEFISTVIMFQNASKRKRRRNRYTRIEDLKTMLRGMVENFDMSDQNIDSIIEATTDVDGTGPFVKKGTNEKMNAEEIKEIVKNNVENMLKTVDRIAETTQKIVDDSYGNITGKRLDNLVYLKEMADQYLDKAKDDVPALLNFYKSVRENLVKRSEVLSTNATKQQREQQEIINTNIANLDILINLGEEAIKDGRNKERKQERFLTTLQNEQMRDALILMSLKPEDYVVDSKTGKVSFFSAYNEKMNTTYAAFQTGVYLTEYNRLFNLYMDDKEYAKDIAEIDEEEKKKAKDESTNETIGKLKDRIKTANENKEKIGFAEIEELVKDEDLDSIKESMEADEELSPYVPYIDSINFKRAFLDFINTKYAGDEFKETRDRLTDLVNAVKSLKDSLKDFLTNINPTFVKAALGINGKGSLLRVSTAVKEMQDAIKAFNANEKAETREPMKGPEAAPQPKFEKKQTDLSKEVHSLSKKIGDAFENGNFDISNILEGSTFTIDVLKDYIEKLKAASEVDPNFSESEKKNKDYILEELEKIIKARLNPTNIKREDANPLTREEKAKIDALEDAAKDKEEEEKQSHSIFRNWIVTVYEIFSGKHIHKKVVLPNTSDTKAAKAREEVWKNFNIQDLLDSGDFAKLIKGIDNVRVSLFRDWKTGNIYVAYKAFNDDLDAIDKGAIKYPRILASEEGQSYILLGDLGADKANQSDLDLIKKVVRTSTLKVTPITVKVNDIEFRFAPSSAHLSISNLYSGRFEKSYDEAGNEIYKDVRQVGDPLLGVVIEGEIVPLTGNVKFEAMNKHVAPELREGMVVVGVRGADGKLYATPVLVKRFTPKEVEADSDAANAVRKALRDFTNAVYDKDSTLKDKMKALRDLKKVLYFGSVSLHFNPKNSKIEFKLYKNKKDGSPEKVISGNAEDAAAKLFDKLYSEMYNLPFNISVEPNGYKKALELGVMTTDLASYQNFNASFDMVYDNAGTQRVSTEHTGSREKQNKPVDVIINGKRMKVTPGVKKKLENNGITGVTGEEIIAAISSILEDEVSPEGLIADPNGKDYYLKTEDGYIVISKSKTGNSWEIDSGEEVNEKAEALASQQENPAPISAPQIQPGVDPNIEIATSLDADENPEPESAKETSGDKANWEKYVQGTKAGTYTREQLMQQLSKEIKRVLNDESSMTLEEIFIVYQEILGDIGTQWVGITEAIKDQMEIEKTCITGMSDSKFGKLLQETVDNIMAPNVIEGFKTEINCF